MTTGAAHKRVEVIVVGGGQSGLAIGYLLGQHKLFTPSRSDAFPGLAFPGDPDHYPSRDEVAAYLTDHARRHELPVELGSRVRTIRKTASTYMVELDDRTVRGRPGRGRHRPVPGPPKARGCSAGSRTTRPTSPNGSAHSVRPAADALTSAPAERRVP